MPGIVFHARNTEIRIYDGTSGGTPPGPYYYDLKFEQLDFNAPLGRERPPQIPKLNRGVLDADGHYIQGSDIAILEPIPVTFSIELLDTEFDTMLAVLSNLFRESPWTVANQTWTNTNASTQIRNGDGVLVTTPATAEPDEDRVNIEVRNIKKHATAVNDLVLKWNEVWFPPRQDFRTAIEGNRLTLNGLWKGDIVKATTFTTGTDTTA